MQVSRINAIMKRVYLNMTGGLLFTGVVAWLCVNSMAYLNFYDSNRWFMWVLIAAQFVMLFAVQGAASRLNAFVAALCFYGFAGVFGMTYAPILLFYTTTSIVKTFFITAGTFGAMSVYGFFTDKDLTKWGNILFMALIGLIIASVVNLFMRSDAFSFIISIFGVLIFVGLTAWDTQKIKQMAMQVPAGSEWRLSIIGALELYLDFVNLFLYLLRIFGNRRD